VTYSFDDGNSSQIEHYPALSALGVPFTFYLITDKDEAMSEIWAAAVTDGHELGNHTQTHPYDATAEEIDDATAFIESRFGVKVWTMAAPFGDDTYIPFAESRFLINRGAFDAQIFPDDDSDPFNLPCFVPDEEAPASDFHDKIDAAREDGAWQIMLVHGFTGGDDGAFQPVEIDEFVASVEYAKALGDVWLDTVVSIGSYWRGQRAVAASDPTTKGDTVQYEWELPDHFPPGKCLRVTTTGGNLEQGGRPVPWNQRGYYEIALDAEALTISP
jgi:peptidoglycan/xylan/chitin deacetylase (PgdA/CDA1 family)